MNVTTVYLSSTYSDLKDYREAVYHVLRQMHYDVIAMEDYVATDLRPLDKCLSDIEACDLYIGIFAWHYGYVPPTGNPEHKSITEREYRTAAYKGKTCLIFLLEEDAPWSPTAMDVVTGENDRGERIKALRRELVREKVVTFFRTPEQLASCVGSAIHIWESFRNSSFSSDTTNHTHRQIEEKSERERWLKAMLADHSGFTQI